MTNGRTQEGPVVRYMDMDDGHECNPQMEWILGVGSLNRVNIDQKVFRGKSPHHRW